MIYGTHEKISSVCPVIRRNHACDCSVPRGGRSHGCTQAGDIRNTTTTEMCFRCCGITWCLSCRRRVAPMSVMTGKNAMPWAERSGTRLLPGACHRSQSIRAVLSVKGVPGITSPVNMIVVWAAGGTPQGNVELSRRRSLSTRNGRSVHPTSRFLWERNTRFRRRPWRKSASSSPTNITNTKWVKPPT